MGLFRKKKKKRVYSTDLVAVKVFEDDLLEQTKIRLILDKVRNNKSAKDYIMNYANTGAAQFFQYYLSGKHDFSDELPDATIGAVGVNSSIIETIIKEIENNDIISFVNLMFAQPDDEIWVKWQLQQTIGLDVGSNFVFYNGDYYSLDTFEYDEVTDKFSVTLTTQHSLTIITKDITKIVSSTIDSIFDNERTIVTRTVSYVDVDTNDTLLYTTNIISTTDTTVIKDTGRNTVTSSVVSMVGYTNPDLSTTFNIDVYKDETPYYIIEYILVINGITKLWIYDPITNVYPQLTTSNYTTFQYETYPIVMFRNGVFSVDEYDINSKVVSSGNVNETIYRPSTVTEARYNETKGVLSSIGLTLDDILKEIEENESIDKVQDGFILVGVSPSNKVPIVSKALYNLFNYIYNKLPPTQFGVDSTYHMDIYETPYNAQLSWVPQLPYVSNEVIGGIGTCTHDFIDDSEIKSSYTLANYVYYPKQNREYVFFTNNTNNMFLVTTDSNGRKWTNIIVSSYTNDSGNLVNVYEQREVIVLSSTRANLIKYTTISLRNMVIKKQINSTQTRTIKLGNLAPNQTGVSTQAGEYLWNNWISRGAYGGEINLKLDDERLVIPLPVPVVESLTYMERTDLMAWGVYMIFYAAQYDVITYYKGTFFAKFLTIAAIVVAIVITIVTYGAASPLVAGLAGLTAAGIGTALSGIIAVFESLLIGLALTIALKLISSSIGNVYIKMALSIAAMAVAAYIGGGFNSFNLDLKTAVQLSEMATKVVDMYVDTKTAQLTAKMNKLQNTWSQFRTTYSERTESFDSMLKQINSGIDVDFMVQLATDIGTSFHANTSYSPSLLRHLMIDGYKDFDVLYENEIDTFYDRQLQLGILTADNE